MYHGTAATARLMACTEVMQEIFGYMYGERPALAFDAFKSFRMASKLFCRLSNAWAFKSFDLTKCHNPKLLAFSEIIAPAYGSLVRELIVGPDKFREDVDLLLSQMRYRPGTEQSHEEAGNDKAGLIETDAAGWPLEKHLPKRYVMENAILDKCIKLVHLSYQFPKITTKHKLSIGRVFPPLVSSLTSLRLASRDAVPISAILAFFRGDDSRVKDFIYEYMPSEEEWDDFGPEDQELLEAIVGLPRLENLTIFFPPFLKGSFNQAKVKAALKCRNLRSFEHKMGTQAGIRGHPIYSTITIISLLNLIGIFCESVENVTIQYSGELWGMMPPPFISLNPLRIPRLTLDALGGIETAAYFDTLRPSVRSIINTSKDIEGQQLVKRIKNRKQGNFMTNVTKLHLGREFWLHAIGDNSLQHAECVSNLVEGACKKEGIILVSDFHDIYDAEVSKVSRKEYVVADALQHAVANSYVVEGRAEAERPFTWPPFSLWEGTYVPETDYFYMGQRQEEGAGVSGQASRHDFWSNRPEGREEQPFQWPSSL